jgi:hypothetical protein|tara:strand:- start:1010 stop:1156 length:147 start_codon:yes stop_codon:yes gene_type:complete
MKVEKVDVYLQHPRKNMTLFLLALLLLLSSKISFLLVAIVFLLYFIFS